MIGIFDSGLGGIFLLKELSQQFPKQSFIYLADRKNFPYGEKSSSLVRSLVKKNINFLINQGAEHIIVACNTASVTLRDADFHQVPVKGVIEASLRQAKKDSLNKKVGLLATLGTVKSQVFLKKLKKLNFNLQIYQQACPLLAPFVEQGGWNINRHIAKNKELDSLLEKYLQPLINKGVDTVIMGCTHYLYLEPAIKKYIGKNKKTVGPVNFLIKDLYRTSQLLYGPDSLGLNKVRIHSKKQEQKNKRIRTKETNNKKINIFINGQNKDFGQQLHQIWEQKKDIPISIKII